MRLHSENGLDVTDLANPDGKSSYTMRSLSMVSCWCHRMYTVLPLHGDGHCYTVCPTKKEVSVSLIEGDNALYSTGCHKTFTHPLLAICLLSGPARVNLLIAKHFAPRPGTKA
jgi:hypothetical protein